MQNNFLYGKKVLVIGCGESGLAMANWCILKQAQVYIADSRENPPMRHNLNININFHYGINQDTVANINPELILVSPGLSPHFSFLKDIYIYSQENNILIQSELWLFNQALSELRKSLKYEPKILAITGTNGKTTTTNLTAHLCKEAGFTTAVAGNISPSLLQALYQYIEHDNLPQIWILELSSFQLHNIDNFNSNASAILNITNDHLDWHLNLEEYIKDKFNIIGKDSQVILNRQDKYLNAYIDNTTISFGIDLPENNSNNWGLNLQPDGFWIYYKSKNLIPINSLKIRGLHNAQNVMTALALCAAIKIDIQDILASLRTYQGESHRVELITIINDIEIYDDSKGTNVGATIAAIEGLGKQIVLIAGGDGKGQNFSDLSNCFKKYIQSVHLIGKDKQEIAKICIESNISYFLYDTLEEATINAYKLTKPHQALLLSPACASLDMFKNYTHRANIFKQTITNLIEN